LTPVEEVLRADPRTKPEMMRPPEATSSIAIFLGDAQRVLAQRQAVARIAILARVVRRTSIAAITLGLGIVP